MPVIETFARLGGTPEGFSPKSVPVQGTTSAGGLANCGTIYRVAADGTLTTLYSFRDTGDGSNPSASLILGPDGNFYGTTPLVSGGSGQGTVFRVTPTGALTTLHQFSTVDGNSSNGDGADPEAALLLGADGNFYGTTTTGGAGAGGTVFKMTPTGVLTTLANFSPTGTGAYYGPQTPLVQGNDGNFYGTTQGGGVGVIFTMTPGGAVTLLYAFTGAADGGYPGALTRGSDGNFYGLAALYVNQTGAYSGEQGTALQITPAGVLTTLHGFDEYTEGVIQGSASTPPSALIQGADGNFYGVAGQEIRGYNGGTVFRLTPAGAVTVLYTFPFTPAPASFPIPTPYDEGYFLNGTSPAGVIQGMDGNFYGVMQSGGDTNFTPSRETVTVQDPRLA